MPPAGLRSRKAAIGEALAERLQQLDLGVGQHDEHDGDAMLGLRQRLRDLGAQRGAILRHGGGKARHGNGDVVEAPDHGVSSLSGLPALSGMLRVAYSRHRHLAIEVIDADLMRSKEPVADIACKPRVRHTAWQTGCKHETDDDVLAGTEPPNTQVRLSDNARRPILENNLQVWQTRREQEAANRVSIQTTLIVPAAIDQARGLEHRSEAVYVERDARAAIHESKRARSLRHRPPTESRCSYSMRNSNTPSKEPLYVW